MSQWQKADKCKACGRVYSGGREICKCGTVLRKKDVFISLFTNCCMVATENCECVIAKRRMNKWIVKEVSE